MHLNFLLIRGKDQEISDEEMAKFLERVGVLNGYEDRELHLQQNNNQSRIYSDYGENLR